MPTTSLTVDQLIELWHGDPPTNNDPYSHVTGYWHPELVIAACQQTNPATVDAIRARFYPSKSAAEAPEQAVKLIRLGFDTWKRRSHQ